MRRSASRVVAHARCSAGTHPELIHLTKLIEARRERRVRLGSAWFEHQQRQYERVGKAEEAMEWSAWRVSARTCAASRMSAAS
jgi:hypothetical protein